MKQLLFVILILSFFNASAQNYNCFQPGKKNYFINGNKYVRGIRIDSVKSSGTDVIYYPYKTQRISNYLPGAPSSFLGGSWLGGKVIARADGTFLFDNLWDTVVIKTQAAPGDTWVFYNDTSHFSYNATVTAADTMTVMGSLDSIKKIAVYCDSYVYSYPNDPVNFFEIWLSKNHGFVQVFDLYTFPYHRPDTISFTPPHFCRNIRFIDYYLDVLLGNLGTCMGCYDHAPDTDNSVFRLFDFYDPAKTEIFNFSIGDVFETRFVANNVATPYFFEAFTLDSVLTKTTVAGDVAYTGPEHIMSVNLASTYPATVWDTTYSSGSYSGFGDTSAIVSKLAMPEESTGAYLLHYFPKNVPFSGLCDSPAAYVIDEDFKGTGFAFDGLVYLASSGSSTYSMGYGLTQKDQFVATSGSQQQQGYVFYLKAGDSCGTYINTIRPHNVGIGSISGQNSIAVWPNPASGSISISGSQQLNSEVSVSVHDMAGKAVFQDRIYLQNACSINTSQWNDGIYLLTVQDGNGDIAREKVLVMH